MTPLLDSQGQPVHLGKEIGTKCKTCHAGAYTSITANDALVPNGELCDACHSTDHSDVTNCNSFHSGGANMLFADGSVKFIKSTIAMKTYWAIGTRNLGETVSSDAY